MIERLPRGQFPVNAVIGREGKRTRHFHPLRPLLENLDPGLSFRIVCSKGHQHADASHPFAPLRTPR
jgi:hypothetical protein